MTLSSYPINAFPDLIQQAIKEVDSELGGGIELAASAALGVVSVVCQEFVNVRRPRLRPTSCSLFLVTIARTGAGKSEIQGRFMSALDRFEREEESRIRNLSVEPKEVRREERADGIRTLRLKEKELLDEHDAIRERDRTLRVELGHVDTEVRQRGRTIEERHARREAARLAAKQLREKILNERQQLKLSLHGIEQQLTEVKAAIRASLGPVARRLVYGRGSFAGFRNGLQDKCRSAGIISAEAGGVLNSALVTRNMDAWNDLWGCEFYRETFDKREYVIESPRLTVALMLQPKQFEKFIDTYGENALDNGFLSRTLLLQVPAQSPKLLDQSDELQKEGESLQKFLLQVRDVLDQDFPGISERVTLIFSEKAKKYWENYYNNLMVNLGQEKFEKDMEGFVRKLPEQAARIAALFHYFSEFPSTEKKDISFRTIQAAIELCDWYMFEFRKIILSNSISDQLSIRMYSSQIKSDADKIIRTIRKNYRKISEKQNSSCIRLSYRDIQNANRTIKRRADIANALEFLEYEQEVRRDFGPNGGILICYQPDGYYCGRCHGQAFDPKPGIEVGSEKSTRRSTGETMVEGSDETHSTATNEDLSPVPSLLDVIAHEAPYLFRNPNTPGATAESENSKVLGDQGFSRSGESEEGRSPDSLEDESDVNGI